MRIGQPPCSTATSISSTASFARTEPTAGCITEAGRCARDFAYRELGWSTLVSFIAPANTPSQQVAVRLGAVREHDLVLRGAEVGLYRHPSAAALRR